MANGSFEASDQPSMTREESRHYKLCQDVGGFETTATVSNSGNGRYVGQAIVNAIQNGGHDGRVIATKALCKRLRDLADFIEKQE